MLRLQLAVLIKPVMCCLITDQTHQSGQIPIIYIQTTFDQLFRTRLKNNPNSLARWHFTLQKKLPLNRRVHAPSLKLLESQSNVITFMIDNHHHNRPPFLFSVF